MSDKKEKIINGETVTDDTTPTVSKFKTYAKYGLIAAGAIVAGVLVAYAMTADDDPEEDDNPFETEE